MKKIYLLIVMTLTIYANSCIQCHKGIEHIRDPKSKMMKEILDIAKKAGVEGNDCVVCHGGNPDEYNQTKAHSGTHIF